MTPDLLFFFKISWAALVLLWLRINFWIICYSSVKIIMGSLMGIALSLYIALICMAILTILILLIHAQGLSFLLSVSSLMSRKII